MEHRKATRCFIRISVPDEFLPARCIAGSANRSITTIIEIVGCRPVGRCADMGQHSCSVVPGVAAHMFGRIGGVGVAVGVVAAGTGIAGVAAERAGVGTVVAGNVRAIIAGIAVHPSGLGGKRGAKDHGGEGEFGQCFHGVYLVFCCPWRFIGTAFTRYIANGFFFLTTIFQPQRSRERRAGNFNR